MKLLTKLQVYSPNRLKQIKRPKISPISTCGWYWNKDQVLQYCLKTLENSVSNKPASWIKDLRNSNNSIWSLMCHLYSENLPPRSTHRNASRTRKCFVFSSWCKIRVKVMIYANLEQWNRNHLSLFQISKATSKIKPFKYTWTRIY